MRPEEVADFKTTEGGPLPTEYRGDCGVIDDNNKTNILTNVMSGNGKNDEVLIEKENNDQSFYSENPIENKENN